MAHGLGLAEEGQRAGLSGLGLAAPTVLAGPGAAPGQAPREVDTAGAAARARAPAKAAPAAPQRRIPQFSDNPLKTIAFALSEGALAFAGRPTNLGRLLEQESQDVKNAQAEALAQEGLKLRRTAATFDAVKFGLDRIKLEPDKRDEIIKAIGGVEGVPGAGDMMRAMSEPGIDSEAVLGFLDENPDLVPGLSGLLEKGVVDAEDAVGLVTDLIGKQAEAAIKSESEIKTAKKKQAILAPGKIAEETAIAQAKAAAKGDKGALTEEDGSVKTAASSELRRQSVLMHGGFINPRTGETSGLTSEAAQSAINIAAEAERMIKDREATSLAEATKKASLKIGVPVSETPEIQIPDSVREKFLVQNAEIATLLPAAQEILGDVDIGVGGLSNLAAIADATVGQLMEAFGADEPIIAKDTQQARANIRRFNQEVKRAVVNNPKFPKFEQEIVEDLLPDPDAWFANPRTAMLNFNGLIQFLNRKLTTNGALLQGKLPEGMKGPGGQLSEEEQQELDALRAGQGAP